MKSKTYEEFVEKFKPKLTTDDCYTPPLVYEAVKGWACKKYGIDPDKIVRPFWPGADYTTLEYPDGCVVLDNPPFSILSRICKYYLDRQIRFFLFAPSLTALHGKGICLRMNHIFCDTKIVYENGAAVRTAFVTNLGDGETIAQTAPALETLINEAVNKTRAKTVRTVPKHEYPGHVLTAAMMLKYSGHGVEFSVSRSECTWVEALDAQKDCGKSIFGSGLLLSDKAAQRHAAAQRAAAEHASAKRAAATVWKLSDREKGIVQKLSLRD